MRQPNRRQLLAGVPALFAARQAFSQDLDATVREGSHSGQSPDGPAFGSEAYDLASDVTYLNHASIGTMPRLVREAQSRYQLACESNPWLHVWGGAWSEAQSQAHAAAADFLGVPASSVAIIRNATAAFGMAANGLPIGRGHEVLYSSLNHVGASASWSSAAGARGYTVRRFDFPEGDVASMSLGDVTRAYVDAITDGTEALVLPHVDNVYGIRHDVAAIATAARSRGVRWILVDGAQSVGMHAVDVSALGVDVYATSAHKWLQAPKGTGLMALSPAAIDAMRPLVTSWAEDSAAGTARSFTDFGTRDIVKIMSVADAIEFHRSTGEGRAGHHARMHAALSEHVAADERLIWRSPMAFAEGAALVAVGLKNGSAKAIANALFEKDRIIVRGFEGAGRNHVRVSPNTMNSEADLSKFFGALSRQMG